MTVQKEYAEFLKSCQDDMPIDKCGCIGVDYSCKSKVPILIRYKYSSISSV